MLTLWEHPLSPYAQKNKIAMREKGIAFEATTPMGIGSGKSIADFEQVSPLREVPALVDDGFSIFDSRLILEYLEDRYPGARRCCPRIRASAPSRARSSR